MGRCLCALGRYEDAVTRLIHAHELDQKDYEVCFSLGNVYAQMNRHSKAIDWFLKAVELNNLS